MKRSSRPQAAVCTETFQNFSLKNDLTCFHCLLCRKGGHLAIFRRPRRTDFFGQKGGQVLQKEDVRMVSLPMSGLSNYFSHRRFATQSVS